MILLKNVNVFNGKDEVIQENLSVLIGDDKIQDISPNPALPMDAAIQEIDGDGMTILPGLINVHVHLSMDTEQPFEESLSESCEITLLKIVKNARKTLEAGITTVRDLGCRAHLDFEFRKGVEMGLVPAPRMLLSGEVITKTGGHGHFIGREADGEAEITKAVREQIKAGADIVKVMATGGVMTEGVEPGLALYSFEEVKAATEEAKRCQKLTASHAQGTEGIKNAVIAGIDTIEHGIYMTEEVIKFIFGGGRFGCITLARGCTLFESSLVVVIFSSDISSVEEKLPAGSTKSAFPTGISAIVPKSGTNCCFLATLVLVR